MRAGWLIFLLDYVTGTGWILISGDLLYMRTKAFLGNFRVFNLLNPTDHRPKRSFFSSHVFVFVKSFESFMTLSITLFLIMLNHCFLFLL